MSEKVPTREEAYKLLTQYNQNDSLIKHALAVEGVMRYFARKRGEDEEKWGIIGLVHDLDYGQFPEEHCRKSEEILRSNNCFPFCPEAQASKLIFQHSPRWLSGMSEAN